ncbi:MAG: 3-phosphoshikimate 1-carboxyvinyltransferase [Candidatus Omnitrophica bacterium]|nr:3-phosphoshikimate 1-carboxyvinyltransferase [Candidatus Omnitrophota bacterium]
MKSLAVTGSSGFSGTVRLPGDKSIAHRACILGALSSRTITIHNFPLNDDCRATVEVFRRLGIRCVFTRRKRTTASLVVSGKGLHGLARPGAPIFIKESGTTMRLLLGVLAGQPFATTVCCGASLSKRPMRRVTEPLRQMGARIRGRKTAGVPEEYPPVLIEPAPLHGITYRLPIASAQVKSALLLAALFAKGATRIVEPIKTRDHTERMLRLFGAGIKLADKQIVVTGGRELFALRPLYVPGDISSAGYFMILALLSPDSHITIKGIGLNPSRSGIIRVLKRMGARIKVTPSSRHRVTGEPIGEIAVRTSGLRGTTIKKEEIPSLIDELPVLMVAACLAKGTSVFKGVQELRLKESDRITAMVRNLRKMGASISVIAPLSRRVTGSEDIVIQGKSFLKGAKVNGFQDHRVAMSMAIAGLCAGGRTVIDDVTCISKSFPGFLSTLKSLSK